VLRFRDIRLIGPDNEQIGILQSRQALQMAKDAGLDLVMVAPNAQPPVCRILDYGKFKYLTEKQKKESKHKSQDVKGIKISPRIAEHDIQTALKKSIQFLEEGHKVKITCQFRAREVTHPENGINRLNRMAEQVKDIAVVERPPSMEGRLMIMILVPRPGVVEKAEKKKKDGKESKAENAQDGGEAIQSDGDGQDNSTEVG